MQALIRDYLQENLVNIIGGCCGTTPEHIKLIAEVDSEFKPRLAGTSSEVSLTYRAICS